MHTIHARAKPSKHIFTSIQITRRPRKSTLLILIRERDYGMIQLIKAATLFVEGFGWVVVGGMWAGVDIIITIQSVHTRKPYANQNRSVGI